MIDYGRIRTDLLALALLAGSVFLGLSLVSFDPADPPAQVVYPLREVPQNLCGATGAELAHHLFLAFGLGAYFVLASLVVVDIRLFTRETLSDPLVRLTGAMLVLVSVCAAAQFFLPEGWSRSLIGNGGYVGAWSRLLMEKHFSTAGSLILLATFATAGLLLTGEIRLVRWLFGLLLLPLTMWSKLAFRRPAAPKVPVAAPLPALDVSPEPVPAVLKLAEPPADEPEPISIKLMETKEEIEEEEPAILSLPEPAEVERKPIRVNPPVSIKSFREETLRALDAGESAEPPKEFQLPTSDLLEEAEEFPYEALASKAQGAAATLEKTFKEFGLNVKVVEIDTGPVVTQFELELEAGLRLSKVTALADDLAIALRVPAVRVVAPIPGKNTVGVEVPNDLRVMVRLKELLEASQKDIDDKRIPLFLGKDVSGKPLVVDMCKLPHLLIAGRTGTGKSVCLNTLILSMLMTRTPDQVKMLMIDPKMVELSPYSRIPHLMHPVITDMKKAEAVLGWAVDKMEERYDLLARVGVRHLDSFNKLGKEKVLQRLGIDPESEEAEVIPEQMPYIVIVADEMADMMMTSGKDVEGHIIRLAQKSRAVGIHLVLATQKPTVDVITGLIKSNLPARISFQVASRVDSRVVLDEMGADKLLGNGDMLYLAPGTSNLTRGQGTYVSDEEVTRVIEFFADREPEYSQELQQLNTSGKGGKGPSEPRERDDLYEQAVEVVIREGRGSVSLLQRALGVGYGRGARMVDWMAEDGIVGTYNGSQAREVVMTMEEWETLRSERFDLAGT
ncbi:DNA translocase FtsK [Planctellipticum variicoloris]|uniref:DNA translocase FtsK n=1 Tax=Planctellipticum variicoloris TaxID=3064265 RepID=UPI003013C668|nr:DNA translocase FtsK [Planctomycetaceae bacterium SH412]